MPEELKADPCMESQDPGVQIAFVRTHLGHARRWAAALKTPHAAQIRASLAEADAELEAETVGVYFDTQERP